MLPGFLANLPETLTEKSKGIGTVGKVIGKRILHRQHDLCRE